MLTVTLPQELERPISEKALLCGLSPETLTLQMLSQSLIELLRFEDASGATSERQTVLNSIVNGKYAKSQSPDGMLASDKFALEKLESQAQEERRWTM